jgi:hypothetical protein
LIENGVNPEALAVSTPTPSTRNPTTLIFFFEQTVIKELRREAQALEEMDGR